MTTDLYQLLVKEGSFEAALDALAVASAAEDTPEEAATYGWFMDWLKAEGIGSDALRVGDPLPDFVLPDHQGRLVTSEELLSRGPIVLSFFRGGWCPYCGLEMTAIEQALPVIEAAGATVVGITPEIGAYPGEMKDRRGVSFRMLADVDNGLALLFGLLFRLPQQIIDLYRSWDVDLPKRQGNEGWMIPVPATYLVDRDGIIRLAFVEADFRIRLDPLKLIDAVKQL